MDERDAIVVVDGCSRVEIYHTPTWPVDMVSWWNNRSGGGHCSRIYAIQTLFGRRLEDAERSFYSLFMLCSYKVKGRGGEKAQERDLFVLILFVFIGLRFTSGLFQPPSMNVHEFLCRFFENKKRKGTKGGGAFRLPGAFTPA